MISPRLTITHSLRNTMAYAKMAGAVPRLLILESQYWIDTACGRAAARMGWPVARVPVVAEGVLPRDAMARLLETVIEFRPDFLLSVNLSGMDVDGMLAHLFDDLGLPFVTWFVDDPRTIVMDRKTYATPHTVAFSWERAYVPYLRTLGFPVTGELPLAVDTSLFNAEPGTAWDLPCTFVGNSMTTPAARALRHLEDDGGLRAAIEQAFEAGHVTREHFAAGLPAILPAPVLERLNVEYRVRAELALFTEGTRRLRQRFVQAFEHDDLCVFGDEGWNGIAALLGAAVDYENGLASVYRRSAVNLNVTSIQMATAVNQRVFDCPAAGGFLITDAQSSLAGLFDLDSEIVCYRSFDEAARLLREFRDNHARRNMIVQRARARILHEHTYEHRLQTIAETVRQHFG